MTADLLPDTAAPNTALVAAAPVDEVLRRLDSSAAGLSSAEAAARLTRYGPNAVRTHHVNVLAVLGRQLRNAVLILLAGTAIVSYFLGDSMQAIIIGIILAASIGLGFINEYRAERAAADLHASVHHNAVVRRDGEFVALAVTALVPGDVIRLSLGEAVPADVRLIDVSGLECNESILTGESTGSEKSPQPVPPGTGPGRRDRPGLHGHHRQCRRGHRSGVRHRKETPNSGESHRVWTNASPKPASRSGCAGSPTCCCKSPSR